MSVSFQKLPGLSVTVDQVSYEPDIPAPPERPHPFVYFLSIHNDAEEPVTIVGRKWIVTDDAGGTLVVEGDGVVGKFPRIVPGDKFSYNSYHVIHGASTAHGTFFGQTDAGLPVCVRIPDFRLELPD